MADFAKRIRKGPGWFVCSACGGQVGGMDIYCRVCGAKFAGTSA